MLCGLPFAGKSTLARRLAERFGWAHLEIDAIMRERGIGFNGEEIHRSAWSAAYREGYRRLALLLDEGRSVVYDATNFRRLQRDQVRRIAAKGGATTRLIYVQTPEGEAQRRRQRNRVERLRVDVRDEDFAEVRDRWQPLDADEDALVYDGSSPIDQWIAQTFASDRVSRTMP
jgi:predicted kinase